MIDVIDMDEDLGGDDAGQQTPPPPPVPPVQQIDPNVLASQITDRVMASINSQFQNGNQSERVTERIVKEMLASGMPPQAVRVWWRVFTATSGGLAAGGAQSQDG